MPHGRLGSHPPRRLLIFSSTSKELPSPIFALIFPFIHLLEHYFSFVAYLQFKFICTATSNYKIS
jgi:hypothetical protein